MKMKMENGKLANNDKENMEVMATHFTKVYNTRRSCNSDVAKLIEKRETLDSMGDSITWKEFRKAVTKLQNDKSPQENGVPPNAFKSLDAVNLKIVYEYICDFCEGNADYDEWHTGLVKLLQKNDLSSPHNWRGCRGIDGLRWDFFGKGWFFKEGAYIPRFYIWIRRGKSRNRIVAPHI
jgi:hypothetical protein